MKVKLYIGIAVILLIVFSVWMYKTLKSPLPGQAVPELGREHTDDIASVEYNSTPPTSGTHFPMWAKGGIYNRLISDGYLVHSLEHGYVIISYNCDKLAVSHLPAQSGWSFAVGSVSAHNGEVHEMATDSGHLLKHMKLTPSTSKSSFTPNDAPDVEIELSESFKGDSCIDLIAQLAKFTEKWDRVIVVPRIDTINSVVLTAWTRVDYLDRVDEKRIDGFIRAYHNKGPEKTVE